MIPLHLNLNGVIFHIHSISYRLCHSTAEYPTKPEMFQSSYLWLFLLHFIPFASALRVHPRLQSYLTHDSRSGNNRAISSELFADLEELSRIVDIAYCVGLTGTGIQKPFLCASRCQEFGSFQLVTVGRSFVEVRNEAY